MNWRASLGALLLAAGLGGFWYVYEVKGKEARALAKEDAKRVFPEMKDDSLLEATLRAKDRPEIFLRQDGGQWRLIRPVIAPADPNQAGALADTLKNLKKEELIAESGANLAEFGLDKPSATVSFRSASGLAKTLLLGSDNPSMQHVYAMVEGRPEVFMMGAHVKSSLIKQPKDLRDKAIWSFMAQDVQSVRSSFAGGLSLEMDKDGQWNLTAPRREKGSQDEIRAWLSQLGNLRIEDFHEEKGANLEAYGLDRPDGRIELRLAGGGKPLVLLRSAKVHDNKGRYYKMADKPLVFSMAEYAGKMLEKKPEELMDKEAFGFKSYDVLRFEAAFKGGRTLKAVKKDGAWSWDPAKDGDKFDFYGFVSEISAAPVLARLPKSQVPAELTLTFYGEKDAVLEKIAVGAKGRQPASVVAGSQSKGHTVEVSEGLFNKLPQ